MADTKTMIEESCSAFTSGTLTGALARMTQDVTWSKETSGRRK